MRTNKTDYDHHAIRPRKAWWQWLVFGPFTPFFRSHGFRELKRREAMGLVVLSIVTLALVIFALMEGGQKW